ncbi:VanZ family protein [Kineococcus sp. LSe6-4]|uniref:VanZ family protein n=1 Tax=Kineococcus halophytocola TaxID=3234027 RepID=A0ABV4H132_9ACTN
MLTPGAETLFRQVPVLPVVVPVAAVAFLGLLWSLRRRGRLSLPRAAVAAALCVYLAGTIANTVFPVFLDKPTGTRPWSAFLNVVPVVGYEPADFAMNVAVFVPLGVLVALVVTRPSWTRVLAVAAAISATIEVTQFVTATTLGGGHVADVNDLLSNVVGGLLGAGLLALLDRVPAVRAVVDRFRWQDGSPAR